MGRLSMKKSIDIIKTQCYNVISAVTSAKYFLIMRTMTNEDSVNGESALQILPTSVLISAKLCAKTLRPP